MAKKISLQIILTDIMMPGADGYDVCDTLRGDIKTSHIPIIVMSGLGGADQKIKALKKGQMYLLKNNLIQIIWNSK